MEGVKMIGSLDSLWFFSNVLSSKKIQPLARSHGDEDDGMNPKVKIFRSEFENSKPITHILETHQTQSPTDEILAPTLDNSKPITQILETQHAQLPIGETVGPKFGGNLGSEERERSKTRVKKKKKNTQKNTDDEINWGGYDLGFGINNVNEFWMLMKGYDEEEKRFTSQNLPPFSDRLAMKQHLKSWAYAVACNVR